MQVGAVVVKLFAVLFAVVQECGSISTFARGFPVYIHFIVTSTEFVCLIVACVCLFRELRAMSELL